MIEGAVYIEWLKEARGTWEVEAFGFGIFGITDLRMFMGGSLVKIQAQSSGECWGTKSFDTG